MDRYKFLAATALVAALSIPTIANSALVGRLAATEGGTDYQAYYDTEADLTWLADANYAQTSGYAAGYGRMNWADANAWAAQLTVGGNDTWRLADTSQPDASCATQSGGTSYGDWCTGSEMGSLFYTALGNVTGQATTYLDNTGPFSNIQYYGYWTATERSSTNMYYFGMGDGSTNIGHEVGAYYAWAMQTGDVEPPSAVPIPSAIWLFGSGLIGLIGFAKRKK